MVPELNFGSADPVDWRAVEDSDEELEEIPAEVVAIIGFDPTAGDSLEKSRVKAHTRRTPTGAVTQVRAYTNKRTKKEETRGQNVGRRSAVSGAVRGRSPSGRPGLRVASEGNLPTPKTHVRADQYGTGLDAQQLLGVNLALDRFAKGGEGFLLADGTGVGKTRQLLVIAQAYAQNSGKSVLIVTENKQVISGSFAADGEALGIPFNVKGAKLTITTYSALATGNAPAGRHGLVIFDEAHNLKNVDAKKTDAASSLEADHRLYATATPMDRPTAASYFLAAISGLSEDRVQKALGFTIEDVLQKDGTTKRFAKLLKDTSWTNVLDNIVEMRDRAIRDGAMVRREYPFYGEVGDLAMRLSAKDKIEQDTIDRYYENKIREAKDQGKSHVAMNLAGQRILELSRWLEPKKIEQTWAAMEADLAAGRSVVIVAEGVNPTAFKALGPQEHPAFLGLMAARLKKAKIAFSQVYGAGEKAAEIAKFQAGKTRVLLMTPKSGGTGVNLDDTAGDRPRSMYIVTANFSGDVFEQILGRVSRRNTRSPSKVTFIYAEDGLSDDRRKAIVKKKIEALRKIQHGGDLDAARGFDSTEEAPETPYRPPELPRKAPGQVTSGFGGKALDALSFTPYSDRSTAIRGETYRHKDAIKAAYRELGIMPVWNKAARAWMVPTRLLGEFKSVFHSLTKSRQRRKPLVTRRGSRILKALLVRRQKGS